MAFARCQESASVRSVQLAEFLHIERTHVMGFRRETDHSSLPRVHCQVPPTPKHNYSLDSENHSCACFCIYIIGIIQDTLFVCVQLLSTSVRSVRVVYGTGLPCLRHAVPPCGKVPQGMGSATSRCSGDAASNTPVRVLG